MTEVFDDTLLHHLRVIQSRVNAKYDNLTEMIVEQPDPFHKWLCAHLADTQLYLSTMCYAMRLTGETLNKVANIVETLPTDNAFSGLKEELEELRLNAVPVLMELRRKIADAELRAKVAAEMDGYG